MRAKLQSLFNTIAAALLSLLGFESCNGIEIFHKSPDEYGMPHADYKIIGKVQGEDGPIPGIEVKYRRLLGTQEGEDGQMKEHWLEQSFYTDAEGKIDQNVSKEYSTSADDIRLELYDVDGAENGEYENAILSEDQLDIQFSEDKTSHWHKGTYTIGFEARLNKK